MDEGFGNDRNAEADTFSRIQDYLQNLTAKDKSDMGYQLEDFILDCSCSNGYPCKLNM